MSLGDLKTLLENGLEGCQVTVTGDASGRHIEVTIIGELFAGMSRLKRQQRVYSLIQEQIAAGTLHAVSMLLRTPAEQAQAT